MTISRILPKTFSFLPLFFAIICLNSEIENPFLPRSAHRSRILRFCRGWHRYASSPHVCGRYTLHRSRDVHSLLRHSIWPFCPRFRLFFLSDSCQPFFEGCYVCESEQETADMCEMPSCITSRNGDDVGYYEAYRQGYQRDSAYQQEVYLVSWTIGCYGGHHCHDAARCAHGIRHGNNLGESRKYVVCGHIDKVPENAS